MKKKNTMNRGKKTCEILKTIRCQVAKKERILYPFLHTLEQDKRVKSYEKEAPTGRMRKYYHITKSGLELLEEKQKEWKLFSEKVNGVVFGEVPALG